MIVSLHVERSRFGRALLAIKQNQPAAEAAGINATRWKMYAMMLSAAMAALAGGIYAIILLVVTPQSVFGALTSAQALIVTLFGGVGIFWGPIIGSAILIPAETLHAEIGQRSFRHPGRPTALPSSSSSGGARRHLLEGARPHGALRGSGDRGSA
jgi:branched-chain amino acid transport system permease protein